MSGRNHSDRDRRGRPRYERDLPLSIYDRDQELLDDDPTLRNVSERGMAFVTTQQMETGEEFRFSLGLSGRGVVSGTARVCWVDSSDTGMTYSCGAQIHSLSWRQARQLRKFLNPAGSNLPKFLDALLALACCWVFLRISQDSGITGLQMANGLLDRIMDWLPFATVAGASMAGIVLFFRR